ncbi:MAG: TonB-dependent receptor [Rikenellaceae bacterium]|jgi:TonB-linked SusC/RagA family outer membrane protein|nr:TonB-dependent receptor [Rikenellaceae bacterium]
MKKCLLSLLFAFAAMWGYSQSRTVTGNVVDKENNQPVADATVVVVGARQTTTTDPRGRFSISVPASAKQLTVNHLGYESLTVDIAPEMTIALVASQKAMDEIVISGYKMVKKSDLTGSVDILNADDNFAVGKTDLQQAMQGRLAGVNVTRQDGAPGGGVNVSIRGTNSLFGRTEPLYVIDGVPMLLDNSSTLNSGNDVNKVNALSFLDPKDIETMEILKDASSTAIYGSRGANGVVLITTKSGKAGAGGDRVSLNYNVSVASVTNKLHMLSSAEYAEYVNQTNINTNIINNPGSTAIYPGGALYNGTYSEAEDYYYPTPAEFQQRYGNNNTYWQDQIFRTAVSHDLSLDFSGGAKGFDYVISGGMTNQQGVVTNSSFKRYTGKASLNRDVKRWLKVGTTINISYTLADMLKNATNNRNNGDEGVIRSALYYPSTFLADDPRVLNEGVSALTTNPLFYTTPLNLTKGFNAYTSNYANVTLMQGLVLRTVLGFSSAVNEQNQYYGRKTWEGRDPVNGRALRGSNTWESLVWDNMLMFNRDFGKHNVSATIASSWEDSWSYWENASYKNFASDYSQGWILDGAEAISSASNAWESQLLSGIFRGAYNYDNKYFATLTGRLDSSSKFQKGRRTGFFPSVGLGYTVSREEFMHPLRSIVNNLKLRFSVGNTGNQAIDTYATWALVNNANYPFGNSVGTGYAPDPYYAGNPYLKWEATTQIDAGVDVSIFKRVELTVDFYHKVTKDMLQRREAGASSGLATIWSNIGSVRNRGIEATVNANILNNRNGLKWSVGGSFSANQNKILELGFGDFFPSVLWNAFTPVINAEGRPIGQFYGYITDGVWKSYDEVVNSAQFQKQYPGYVAGSDPATELLIKQKWIGEFRYVDHDGDGEISAKDQVYLGTSNPKFTYGFNTSLSYKGFDLQILFQGVFGNKLYNQPSMSFYNFDGNRNMPVEYIKRSWSPENPDGYAPKFYQDFARTLRVNQLYIEDGSYLKLRSVTLGYTLPKFYGVNNLRVYVSGNNLLTFTKYSGFDPEVNSFDSYGSSSAFRGIDGGGYPQARSFIFGVNLNF